MNSLFTATRESIASASRSGSALLIPDFLLPLAFALNSLHDLKFEPFQLTAAFFEGSIRAGIILRN